MESSPPETSNHQCCKHLGPNHHPSGRFMQDKKSLYLRYSQFILIIAIAQIALSARAQTPTTTFGTSKITGSSSQTGASPIPANSPFLGGTPNGKATTDTLQLSLRDAIDRGLRYNLGLVLSGISSRSARAERLRSLSEMLPHVEAKASGTEEKINLAAFGFPPPAGTSGIIGPFSVFDARGATTDTFDLHL